VAFKAWFAAAVVACVAAGAAQAAPVSPWAQGQLKEMDAGGFGHPVEALTFEGAVPGGQEGAVSVTIPSAGDWALVGSCGEDCTDIGLILDRKDGSNAGQGVSGFKAALQPGTYDLHIGFDRCKEKQCRYVVRAYRKGGL
jgi:hypothetical protein